jgi:hypothetical protein
MHIRGELATHALGCCTFQIDIAVALFYELRSTVAASCCDA